MMKRQLLSAAVCTAIAAYSSLSFAQTQTDADKRNVETLDKITVTGSLIPQVQVETATPITSITAQDIQKQGFKDVYEVLRSQPLATGAVQDSQFSGGFTSAAKPISLLGLDPGFTLVLIDGRPMADYPLLYNGQSNFVDLASVPTAMVERIDIAPGNQSSIYGSSAIAGVVNIILKKRLDGTELSFRMGSYDGGGGGNQRFQLTSGHSWDKLDLTAGLQLSNQDPIYGFNRKDFDSTNDNPDVAARYGSRTFVHNSSSGAYIDPGAAACAPLAGLFGGTTFYDTRPGRGNYCGSRYEPGYSTILNKERSASGYANLNYALNDSTDIYATLLMNRTKNESNSGSRFWQPSLDTSGYIFNNLTGDLESYQRIFSPEETGDVDFNNERQTADSYNVAIGIKGALGQSNWDYNAYYARSEYHIDSRQWWPLKDKMEDFFREHFLGPQLGDYYGYPIYEPNDAGFYQALTPEQYRSFQGEIRTKSKTWTQNVNLQFTNTSLFTLPAGDVGFAGVLQAGQQSWSNPTDTRVVTDQFWGLSGTQGKGKRDNWAAAVELRVPIFSKLTASLSGRYDDYKNDGGGSDSRATWKAALEYRPIDSLLFRGNYATAFKSPDMSYVFAGDSGFYTFVPDYYRCATEQPGVPIAQCTLNDEQVRGSRSGNGDLKSITAKSWGGGVVWSPNSSFTVSADYYRIKIDNKVADLDLDLLLRNESACRQGQLDANSPTCVDALQRIGRAGANAPQPNQLNTVAVNPINVAKEDVSGVTANLDYRWATDSWGSFMLGARYNVTLKHESQQYPEDPVIDLLRNPYYSSEFKNIFSGTLGWQMGDWTTTLYGIRYGRTPNFAAQDTTDGYAADDAGKVKAWTTFNLTVDYAVTDDVSLSLTANNLTAERPPRDRTYTTYPYYNIFNYNGYGRSYMLEMNWRFGRSQ